MLENGTIFEDYKIVNFIERKYNQNYYEVTCLKCGHTKVISETNIKRQNNNHSKQNCKNDYYAEYLNKQFGDYYTTEIIKTNNNGYLFKCICIKCGHIALKSLEELNKINGIKHSYQQCNDDYCKYYLGKQFGDFKIIKYLGYYNNDVNYLAECTICHEKINRSLHSLIKNNYIHGDICLKAIPNSIYKTAIIIRFNDMKQRCNNKNHNKYSNYGGRNIKLQYKYPVDLYHDFIDELKNHANKYGLKNSTFDRIDVNKDYCKDNLRIATQEIQNINTTDRKFFILYKDNEKIISDSAMHVGRYLSINGRAIGNVIRGSSKSSNGWKLYKILTNVTKNNVNDIIKNEGVTTNLIISL